LPERLGRGQRRWGWDVSFGYHFAGFFRCKITITETLFPNFSSFSENYSATDAVFRKNLFTFAAPKDICRKKTFHPI
jgi:hypothetical protein